MLPGCLIVFLCTGIIVAAIVSSGKRDISVERLSDTQETLIFACGYLYGQNSISTQIGLKASVPPESCHKIRQDAVDHGFETARTE